MDDVTAVVAPGLADRLVVGLAWFGLVVSTFLLLGGPTSTVRAPRDPARRLTGGWASVSP